MTRILHLLRHAQSAEKQQGQSDKDRDLTNQGMNEAATIGHFLKKNNFDVDLMVSSGAKRVQHTAQLIHGIINLQSEILVAEELYDASVRNLLDYITHFDDEYKKIILIGHNPYLSYFAEYLTKSEIGTMETAGLVTIHFDISNWAEVTEGNGTMENYTHPAILE